MWCLLSDLMRFILSVSEFVGLVIFSVSEFVWLVIFCCIIISLRIIIIQGAQCKEHNDTQAPQWGMTSFHIFNLYIDTALFYIPLSTYRVFHGIFKCIKIHLKLMKYQNCSSNISAHKMVLYSKHFDEGLISNRNRPQSCVVLIFGSNLIKTMV